MFNKDLFLSKMKQKGLTQEELAKKSGVSRATISRLIQENMCTIRSARLISRALELNHDEVGLIFFDDNVS